MFDVAATLLIIEVIPQMCGDVECVLQAYVGGAVGSGIVLDAWLLWAPTTVRTAASAWWTRIWTGLTQETGKGCTTRHCWPIRRRGVLPCADWAWDRMWLWPLSRFGFGAGRGFGGGPGQRCFGL